MLTTPVFLEDAQVTSVRTMHDNVFGVADTFVSAVGLIPILASIGGRMNIVCDPLNREIMVLAIFSSSVTHEMMLVNRECKKYKSISEWRNSCTKIPISNYQMAKILEKVTLADTVSDDISWLPEKIQDTISQHQH